MVRRAFFLLVMVLAPACRQSVTCLFEGCNENEDVGGKADQKPGGNADAQNAEFDPGRRLDKVEARLAVNESILALIQKTLGLYDQRLTALETSKNEQATTVADLAKRLDSEVQRLSSEMKGKEDALLSVISSLRAELTDAVNGANAETKTALAKYDGIAVQLDSVTALASSLQDQLTKLANESSAATAAQTAAVDALRVDFNKKASDLAAELDKLATSSNAAIAAVDQRIDGLAGELVKVTADVNALALRQTEIEKAQGNLEANFNEFKQLQTEVNADVAKKLSGLRTDTDNLQKQLTAGLAKNEENNQLLATAIKYVTEAVDDLKDEFAAIDAKVNGKISQIAGVTADLIAIKSDLSKLQGDLTSSVTTINQTISNLNVVINSAGACTVAPAPANNSGAGNNSGQGGNFYLITCGSESVKVLGH